MIPKIQNLSDDIAYMRELADAGTARPLVTGLVLAIVGGLFGCVSLIHWALFQFANPENWMILTLWLGAAAACWVVNYGWVIKRMLKKPGMASPSNRAVGWTWNSTGWTVNVLLASTLNLSWRLDSVLPFTLFPSIIAAIYGGAWLVTHRMSRLVWMRWPTFGSFGFALLLALLISTPYLWLAFGAAFFLTVMVPGLIMLHQESGTVA